MVVDAVWLLDDKGFIDCNQVALEMFGVTTKEDLYSKHPIDLSPPLQVCGTKSEKLAHQLITTSYEKGSLRFEWVHKKLIREKHSRLKCFSVPWNSMANLCFKQLFATSQNASRYADRSRRQKNSFHA